MSAPQQCQSCIKCPKGPSQAMCAGCEQWFCRKHFLEHHEELVRRMDDLTVEHDQLQHHLLADDIDRLHPLLARVDQWRAEAIERIDQVAKEVREQLTNLLCQCKSHVQESLRRITHELQESRRMENYTEIDLTKWMNQLKELKEQLDGPTPIEMKNDRVGALSTDIPMITLFTAQDEGKLKLLAGHQRSTR